MGRPRHDSDWVLGLTAGEAAEAHGAGLVGEADRAHRRLHRQTRTEPSPEDEHLHDFRVALRRLRSHLLAYEERLPVPKKRRKALRVLARHTNPARDAEVALAWLNAQCAALEADERADAEAYITSLTEQLNRARLQLTDDILHEWPPLAKHLRRRLHRSLRARRKSHDKRGGKREPSYGQASAALISRQTDRLDKALRRIHSRADAPAIHRARIQAKRLRYLLEPWQRVVGPAGALVDRLRRLQDVSGELHDAQVLEGLLREAQNGSAGGQRGPRPGLAHLVRRLQAQQDARFNALASDHLDSAIDTLIDDAQRVAAIIARWPPSDVDGTLRSS